MDNIQTVRDRINELSIVTDVSMELEYSDVVRICMEPYIPPNSIIYSVKNYRSTIGHYITVGITSIIGYIAEQNYELYREEVDLDTQQKLGEDFYNGLNISKSLNVLDVVPWIYAVSLFNKQLKSYNLQPIQNIKGKSTSIVGEDKIYNTWSSWVRDNFVCAEVFSNLYNDLFYSILAYLRDKHENEIKILNYMDDLDDSGIIDSGDWITDEVVVVEEIINFYNFINGRELYFGGCIVVKDDLNVVLYKK